MKSNICIYVLYTKIAGIWYFEIQQLVETGVLIQFGIWIYHLNAYIFFENWNLLTFKVCIEKKIVKTSQNLKKIDFLFNRIILGLFYVKGIFFFSILKKSTLSCKKSKRSNICSKTVTFSYHVSNTNVERPVK